MLLKLLGFSLLIFFMYIYFLYGYNPFTLYKYIIFNSQNSDLILLNEITIPRIIGCFIGGSSLALSACILQIIYRNPLLSSSTLGIVSSVKMVMILILIFAPNMLIQNQFILQYSYTLLVFFIIVRISKNMGQNSIIILGMFIGFIQSSITSLLTLYNERWIDSIFFWQLGDVLDGSWENIFYLSLFIIPAFLILIFMKKNLQALVLDKEELISIGINVRLLHTILVVISIYISVAVISLFGVIGFVGIIAPNLVRMFKVSNVKNMLVISSFVGAWLVMIADFITQIIDKYELVQGFMSLPAGLFTSVLGGLIIIYMFMQRNFLDITNHKIKIRPIPYNISYFIWFSVFVVVIISFYLGHDNISPTDIYNYIFVGVESFSISERLNRLMLSITTGASLSLCGAILQRLLHNPLASPEVLGVSSISFFVVVVAFVLFPFSLNSYIMIFVGIFGALIGLMIISCALIYKNLSTGAIILVGISLLAIFSALTDILIVFSSSKQMQILQWVNGSFDSVSNDITNGVVIIVLISSSILLSLSRLFIILPLGRTTNTSIGVNYNFYYVLVLFFCVVIIGSVSTAIGPFSLIGLISPYFARIITTVNHKFYTINSMIIGAGLLSLSDGLNRSLHSFLPIPTGIILTLLIVVIMLIILIFYEFHRKIFHQFLFRK